MSSDQFMQDLFKIFLTSGLTVFSGVFVFSLGQLIQKFFIEPVQEQSKAIGEIFFGLVYYAQWYANQGAGDPEDQKTTSENIRRYAGQLSATTNSIRNYDLFYDLGLVPSRQGVETAIEKLIFISNTNRDRAVESDNLKIAKEIRKMLETVRKYD